MNRPELFPEANLHRVNDYRADIDGLRAVAVLAVVAFHAFPAFASGGFVGVDVFFVISGFLITKIIAREIDSGTYSTLRFYERRIRRIAPAFLVAVGVTAIAATFLYVPSHYELFGKSLLAAVLIHSNIFFFKEAGYFSAPDEVMPLLHVWSLSVEEQFYVVFPIFLMIVSKWRIRAWTIALILAASFAASCVMVAINPDAAFYLPQYRAWELLVGSTLALNLIPPVRGLAASAISWVGGTLVAVAIWELSASSVFPGWNAAIPCVGAALIIHAGRGAGLNRLLAWPPFVFVGLISYSLYLWHWPLLSFGAYIAMRPLLPEEAGAAVVLSFLAAWASYRFVETPFRRRGKKLSLTPLFAGTAALIALAVVASVSKGAAWRLPPDIVQVAGYDATRIGMPKVRCGIANLAANDSNLEPLLNVRKPDICAIGAKSASPSVVIWGDSHGDAVAPALDQALLAMGKSGYSIARGGCPPIAGLERMEQPTWQCRPFAEAVIETIKRIHPDLVIIAGNWPYYFEGTHYDPAEHRNPIFSENGNFQAVATALDTTISRLRALAPEIDLMEGIPEIAVDVPSVLGRTAILGRKENIDLAREKYELRQKSSVSVLDRLAQRYNLRLLKPQNILCDVDKCHVTRSGKTLYADSNHLSRKGSTVLEPMFASALQGLDANLDLVKAAPPR